MAWYSLKRMKFGGKMVNAGACLFADDERPTCEMKVRARTGMVIEIPKGFGLSRASRVAPFRVCRLDQSQEGSARAPTPSRDEHLVVVSNELAAKEIAAKEAEDAARADMQPLVARRPELHPLPEPKPAMPPDPAVPPEPKPAAVSKMTPIIEPKPRKARRRRGR
jgi:hypothetical protein